MTKDITSLRSTLDWLRAEGDLIETDKEVNPDLEITGLQKHFDGGPCMLFNNVKGKPHARAITNLFGNIKVVEKMFGWTSIPTNGSPPSVIRTWNPSLPWARASPV
jgi:4-hydroxy-3-polyprenylbenzoate decarboxylase